MKRNIHIMSTSLAAQRLSRFRPTLDTKFHIDYEWWEKSGRDFRLYLRDQLCEECRERFANHMNTENVDWVDPDTGAVRRTDAPEGDPHWDPLRARQERRRGPHQRQNHRRASGLPGYPARNGWLWE